MVGGPGLPTKIRDEVYSCFFEDSEGRFNIIVPSVEVTQGTCYTCNITNQVPLFNGVKAGMYVPDIPMLLNHSYSSTLSNALQFHQFLNWCTI